MNRHLRLTTAVCLVATAVLSVVWTLLEPGFLDDPADRLASLADAGPAVAISALAFIVSQLPFAVAMAGVAAWLRPASPRLATAGGVLAVLGAFGHTVIGGVMMLQLLMAESPEHRGAYAALVGDLESWPWLLPFFAAGLLGTVLGLLLLSIAHFRSRRGPRWVGPVVWVFLLVEFVGSGFSVWASDLAGVLYLAACVGLAAGVSSFSGVNGRPASRTPVA
ncbi:DUF4386 family protein [Nocardioides gansuensis]|nr:DUF4386 family protein [Nocardioides gansuensis]